MLATLKISKFHQPIPVNVPDYGFMAYNQEQAWADNKGISLGSS
jgi:hypothetical protein